MMKAFSLARPLFLLVIIVAFNLSCIYFIPDPVFDWFVTLMCGATYWHFALKMTYYMTPKRY